MSEMSKNPCAGSAPLPAPSPCVRFLKPKSLLRPDQVKQKELGASITCPVASRTPRSLPVPIYFHSTETRFMSEEQHEALELHIHSKRLQHSGDHLSTEHASQQALPQEEGTTSTEGTTPPNRAGTEAGPKGHKWWPWSRKCPSSAENSPGLGSRSESTPRSTPHGSFPAGRPHWSAMTPPSLTASTRPQKPCSHSSSSSQHHSAPVTRYTCSCHLCQACGTKGTLAVPTGSSVHSIRDKISQGQQKTSLLQSSTSERSCHPACRRGRAWGFQVSKNSSFLQKNIDLSMRELCGVSPWQQGRMCWGSLKKSTPSCSCV